MNAWLRSPLRQVCIFVLLGIAAGWAGSQVSPRAPRPVTATQPTLKTESFISLEQASRLWQTGVALFLDGREPEDYAAGHIGNALNLPAQSFAQHFGEVVPLLTRESPLVLYCDGIECDLSHHLAESLRQQGYTNLQILSNGWTAWQQAGLPVTSGSQR